MPVYNEPPTLEDAIRAALEAELPVASRELVIVDDGSTDGKELLEQGDWPEQVRVFRHERNQGKGAAVRTAIAHAEGRWATILDADLEYSRRGSGTAARATSRRATPRWFSACRGFASHSSFSF